MKKKFKTLPIVMCLFMVLTVGLGASSAHAVTTTWTGGNGDWFNAANWDNGVPTSSTDAIVTNGTKVKISQFGATARSLTLGVNQGQSGTVIVDGTSGGRLDVVSQACVPAGDAPYPAAGAIYIGYGGRGTLSIINGGRVTSQSGYLAVLDNPVRPTSNGAVTVNGASSTWIMSGPCGGQFIISGSSKFDPGGTALLTIISGGTVVVEPNASIPEALWVGPSGTLTGNGTITTTSSFRPTTYVAGTLAPGGTLSIGTDFRLDALRGTMLSNVTPQIADRVDVSGYARLGGRLSVVMTGDFTQGQSRYTLFYADGGLGEIHFPDGISIKYPTDQGFEPRVTFSDDDEYVYLDLLWND